MRRLLLGPAVALALLVLTAPAPGAPPARPAARYAPRMAAVGLSPWQVRWDRRFNVRFNRRWRAEHPAPSPTSYAVASWYYDTSGACASGSCAEYGVANLSLPFGTRVEFFYGGRSVEAVVDDRGPYVGGRTWDLDERTAAALGFSGVGTVGYRVG